MHPGLDFDRNYADFGEDDDAEFPFLFISFPSAKDPTFADRHPGAQTIEVVTHMPFARFAHWRQTSWQRRGDEYDALKVASSPGVCLPRCIAMCLRQKAP